MLQYIHMDGVSLFSGIGGFDLGFERAGKRRSAAGGRVPGMRNHASRIEYVLK
jgi:site-specific DNA-cytosine methylase